MDLIDLELVIGVADAGSITHGATRTHLALASASARLRALENTVGLPLFERERRGVTPTPAGQLFLRHARTVEDAIRRMHVELAEYADGHGATVRVLANTAATASLLTPALTTFLAAHPGARVDFEERSSGQIVAAVAEHRAELGIVADTVDLGTLTRTTLHADPLIVLVPPADPLAERDTVAYAAILDRPFVGLGQDSALQEHLDGHAVPIGSRPTYRVRLPTIDAACAAVAAGVGIAILPTTAAHRWIADGRVTAVALRDAWADRRLTICSASDVELANTADALREHLIHAARSDR